MTSDKDFFERIGEERTKKFFEDAYRFACMKAGGEQYVILAIVHMDEKTPHIERLRKYTDVQELTREMCLELIEYITLDAYVEGQPREIYIYYKLLDEPLKDKRSLF